MVTKPHKLTLRERVQMIAALRVYGRLLENALARGEVLPHKSPLVAARFKDVLPMTTDEIETLIGKLDGSHTGRGLRKWDPLKWL